jgi:hypothetical protein
VALVECLRCVGSTGEVSTTATRTPGSVPLHLELAVSAGVDEHVRHQLGGEQDDRIAEVVQVPGQQLPENVPPGQ